MSGAVPGSAWRRPFGSASAVRAAHRAAGFAAENKQQSHDDFNLNQF
jgi:hypothetical protein